jgi:hypothetical protein
MRLVMRESPAPSDPLADFMPPSRAYSRVRLRAHVAANFANFQPVARLRIGG